MAQTYVQILNYGTQAAYESLETKNPNLLYFCQDLNEQQHIHGGSNPPYYAII